MLSFIYTDDGKLARVTTDYVRGAINRNDFRSLDDAERVAAEATSLTGALHVAVDQGPSTFPRFDVIEAPRVGAEVSRGFNGDYYPAGRITTVSKSLRRVMTDASIVFYRRGKSATWLCKGTWAMVPGTRSERNPHF